MAISGNINLCFGRKDQDDFDLTFQQCDDSRESFYQNHWHDCFEIIYVLSGKYHVTIGEREFQLGDGDIAVIPPLTIHSTRSGIGEYYDSIVYGYTESVIYTPDLSISNLKYLAPFRKLRPYDEYILRGDGSMVVQLRSLIKQGADIFISRDALRAINMRANILSVHATLYSIYGFASESSRSSSYLVEAQEYIEKQLPSDISPYEIAREIHISYSHLARMVRAEMGMTVSELITSMRINLAEQIFLNNPGISVTECALAAGFSDSSYFIKQFRRHKGMSPKSLLKMLGQV